jgi:hypothetical protein
VYRHSENIRSFLAAVALTVGDGLLQYRNCGWSHLMWMKTEDYDPRKNVLMTVSPKRCEIVTAKLRECKLPGIEHNDSGREQGVEENIWTEER